MYPELGTVTAPWERGQAEKNQNLYFILFISLGIAKLKPIEKIQEERGEIGSGMKEKH